jgi:hypothetical protein
MKRALVGLAYSVALLLVLSGVGCSKTKSVYTTVTDPAASMRSDTGPDRSGLKKRVLVLPFLNQAGLSDKRTEEITGIFHSLLEKDPRIALEKTAEPIPSTMKMRSPKFGIVMDAEAAKKAEEMAVNVLLTVVVNPYELHLKRTGIWPFRYTKREVEISVIVNGLDLYNGTLFLSHLEGEKLNFQMEDVEDDEVPTKPEMPEIDDKTFRRAFSRIMERQASKVHSAMRNLPWTGRILTVEDDKIIVSAGKRVGLTRDRVLEVFSRGEQVRSAGGTSIYVLGPKLGEVKTVEVMEDFASAKPVTDAEYKAGQVIRAKRQ